MRARQAFQGLLAGFCLASAAAGPAYGSPQVAVTIKPIHALVAGVMAGVSEPELVMEGMASPHTYQLRPSEAAMLVDADLVVWVGPEVESTFPGTIEMLPSSARVLMLTEAQGLVILPMRDRGVWLSNELDALAHRGHQGFDPHIWLDPANAIVLTRVIAGELGALDPGNAARYQANAAAQISRLETLETEIAAALAPVQAVPFITFHDAYQYFEVAFGLSAVASVAISPGRSPGARTVMELRNAIMDYGVRCVFAEPQFEPRLVATLIEGTGANAGILDPLGEAVVPGPLAYEKLMRDLAANALDCLAG